MENKEYKYIKYIEPTFKLIENLTEESTFEIKTQNTKFKNVKVELFKEENFFKFIFKDEDFFKKICEEPNKEVMLKNKNFELIVPRNSIKEFKLNMSDGKTYGKLSELHTKRIIKNELSYWRFIVPVKQHLEPSDFIWHERFKTADYEYKYSIGSLIKILIKKFEFHFYSLSNEQSYYFFIDSLKKMSLEEFTASASSIINGFAFITGYYAGDYNYSISSKNDDFKSIENIYFNKSEATIDTSNNVIYPNFFIRKIKRTVEEFFMSANVFSNLCSILYNEEDFRRTIRIIVKGHPLPIELRTAIYSVALETISNIILEKEPHKRKNPIKKEKSKIIRNELLSVLKKQPENYFNDKNVVLKKIDNINQITNQDKFEKVFEYVGLKLNEEDRYTISKRNDFLHGRIPFEDEKTNKANLDLTHISYKLFYLVSSLVLKHIGYSGYVTNNAKLYDLESQKKILNEPLFRII